MTATRDLPEYLKLAAVQLAQVCFPLTPIDRLVTLADAQETYVRFRRAVASPPCDLFPDFGTVIDAVLNIMGNPLILDISTACIYRLTGDPARVAAARQWARGMQYEEALEIFTQAPLENALALAGVGMIQTSAAIH